MKGGAENRKKTITAGALGTVALICVYFIYDTLFGGTSTPPPSIAPNAPVATQIAGRNAEVSNAGKSSTTAANPGQPTGQAAAGVNAQKLARVSGQFDPTLDEAAMLRTESLVYAGSGRNIFSATYEAGPAEVAAVKLPSHMPPARPVAPAPPGPYVPPPPPPIPLKFFGTVQRSNGQKRVFLLSGDDVYVAGTGEIVARKFKIGRIEANGVQVTDLTSNNTQTVPLQRQ